MTKQTSDQQTKAISNSKNPAAGRTYAGVSQDERKRIRRQQFIAAGIEVFGEFGFRQATVRKLCQQAKLTDRYFYQSFGSIEALLIAVYSELMARSSKNVMLKMAELSANAEAELAKDEYIRQVIECYFSGMQNAKVARICMLEMEGVSDQTTIIYNGFIERYAEVAMMLAEKVYGQWQISAAQRKMMGIGVIGSMRQLTTFWYQSDFAMSRHELSQVAANLVIGAARQMDNKPR